MKKAWDSYGSINWTRITIKSSYTNSKVSNELTMTKNKWLLQPTVKNEQKDNENLPSMP